MQFDGILCYDEFALILTGHIAEQLGLPFISSAVLDCSRRKDGFRKMVCSSGPCAFCGGNGVRSSG